MQTIGVFCACARYSSSTLFERKEEEEEQKYDTQQFCSFYL